MDRNTSNFKASQMPIKQRIQQIDVSLLILLIFILFLNIAQYQGRHQMSQR